jgi:ATP-dependent RNA helicase DeaD
MDHMRRNTLSLDGLKTLVLDEADEMLNMGFSEDIDWIFEHTPADRQVALFSATMPPEILRVARDHLIDPVEIRIESATATVDTIDQQHCVVTRFHKVDVLTRILELEPFDGMLVFVRTKGGTTELVDKLRSQGFAAEALNGDMSQEMRERTVDRLKGGQLDILVATDVAARGLDVERVSHVVNFDIPMDPSAYVHRIGRTGRAGRAGKAILLVEPRERGLLRAIERTIRRPIPEMAPPSAAQLSATRIDRFIEQVRETVAAQDLDFFYRLMARISKEQELEPMNIAAALGFLIQRERPLEVKDPPREPRREYRDDRPRGQDRGRYQDRGQDRGQERGPDRGDRRFGGQRDGNRPPRDRDQPGFARPYAARGPREGGYDRPREGNRDDRPFARDRDARPSDRTFRPEPGNERPFRPDRDGNRAPFEPRERGRERAEPPFRPAGESWQDRPRDPVRGYDRDTRREDRGSTGYPRPAPAHDAPPARDRDGYRDRSDAPREGQREGFRDGPPPRREGGRGGPELIKHRIEVGHRDGVTPREIVGAIANESGLEGRFIGQIDIQDDHSIVDLPAGMPRDVFAHLKRVYVRGRALQITQLDAPRGHGGPRRDAGDDTRRPSRPRDDDRGPRPSRFGGDDGAPRGPRSDQGVRRKRKD